MTFIIDAVDHAAVTPANLKKIGAAGAIVYAGCDKTSKNVTKAELQACLDAGFLMALVVENFATDLGKGKAEGQRQGANIVAAAKAVGYDYENCVLFASADYNTRGSVAELVAGQTMAGFKAEVPVPGIYGNSYLIDACVSHATAEVFWQSESTSFSYGTSPHTHFIQVYGDKRNQGLPFDINNVLRTPLHFMGEDMALTAADEPIIAAALASPAGQAAIKKAVWSVPEGTSVPWTVLTELKAAVLSEQATLAAIQKAVANGTADGMTVAQLAEHLKITAQ